MIVVILVLLCVALFIHGRDRGNCLKVLREKYQALAMKEAQTRARAAIDADKYREEIGTLRTALEYTKERLRAARGKIRKMERE